MEELKRYRNSFILLTLICVAGIMLGIYLYQYTDYFDALRSDVTLADSFSFDASEVLSLFFDELKITAVMFVLGFTLLAPYATAAVILYKGFMTGFSVLCLGIYYQAGGIDKHSFILATGSMVLILIIYIMIGARAYAFSGSLRYAAPDTLSIIKHKNTGGYIVAYLMLSLLLLMAIALKYSVSLL
ncbi:MAG: hypothetical protein IKT46_05090 [Clostridia bacterium]|nr:hypothetical protein [Clostridia bacterium]